VTLRAWPAVGVVVLVVACSSGPAPLPPRPAPTGTGSQPATSTPRERDAIDEALDKAWTEHRLGCALPTTLITDPLVAAVQSVVETDRLSAYLMAQQYHRERCPQR
jgi:hypothetical protein